MTLVDGRYALEHELGAGGLGVVYSARDRELSRRVAIKLLRQRADASPDHLTRLVREANAMARLSHPNVVEVFDVRRYSGLPSADLDVNVPRRGVAVVMELVEGKDLATWLDGERSQPAILETFIAAGRGLAAAHAHGIVHRDFKPANVLIGRDGRVKVTDFGLAAAYSPAAGSSLDEPTDEAPIARHVDDTAWLVTSQLTQTGAAMGTPAYMAPEQHRGRPVDPRTDQYAFCMALAEALYGERPVEGSTMAQLLDSKLRVQLRPLRKLRSTLRPALQRGLSPIPSKRFESMDALLDALQRSPARGRWVAAGLGAAAVGLLAVGRAPAAPASAAMDPPTAQGTAPATSAGAAWSQHTVALTDRPRTTAGGKEQERRAIFKRMRELRAFEDPDQPPEPKLDRVLPLIARAEALGDLALQADLLLSRAALEVAEGNRDEGTRQAERAFGMAVEAGSHVLAARGAALLFAYQDDETPEGERWRRTAEMHIKLAGGEPRAEKYLEDMLARVAARAGRFDEALVHGERLVTLSEEVEGKDHPRVGYALKWNAMYHAELGNLGEAEQTLARGVEVLRLSYPDTHASVLRGRANLASILAEQGRTTEALVELDRALADLALRERDRGGDWVGEEVLWDAGSIMQKLDRHDDAIAYFRRIIPLLPDKKDYWNGFSLHRQIADSQLALGRKADAAVSLRASLEYVSSDSAEWEGRAAARKQLAKLERELSAHAALK